jgi:hypothetical protein
MSVIDSFLPQRTKWRFSGSQSAGVGAQTELVELSVAASVGTYFVTDPTGVRHNLNYLNLEAGIGLSVSWGVTVFGSHESFPSGGVGFIYRGSRVRRDLTLDDLKSGLCLGVTLSKGSVASSADVTLIFMGIPWLTMTPLSMLSDPSGLMGALLFSKAMGAMWSVNARAEIGVAAISVSRGKIF